MKNHYVILCVYTLTLLLSAFLLFLVQPLFGRMVLPLLGGAPSVWNTAMLFFQVTLLAGYGYAHAMARFVPIKKQAFIHILLLILFLFILPLAIPDGTNPPISENPVFWQLGLMAIHVGGPFFVLSASAPLMQHWFSRSGHLDSDNPYFLYAASNLGSVSALLLYPILFEPSFAIQDQSLLWAIGYFALTLFIICAAALIWRPSTETSSQTSTKTAQKKTAAMADDKEIDWKRRFYWILLAFVPSSLMLGLTTFITTDLATAPLLWIIPLGLYVTTFIIAFARKPLISHQLTLSLQGFVFIAVLAFLASLIVTVNLISIVLHLSLFFFTALMCHFELSRSKPSAKHLTQFYLFMSFGGALGGVFNALLAPVIFNLPIEYGLVLILAAFLRHNKDEDISPITGFKKLYASPTKGFVATIKKTGLLYILPISFMVLAASSFTSMSHVLTIFFLLNCFLLSIVMNRKWVFGICAMFILILHPPGVQQGPGLFENVLHTERNFFGVIRVVDKDENVIALMHGTTTHGEQIKDPARRLEPIAYYGTDSGIYDVLNIMAQQEGAQNIAALGLGAGVVACFKHEGRRFTFYEIDPAVVRIAQNPKYFTYLSDCGSPYTISVGDARQTLTKTEDDLYDAILVDVFSSDNIPVHMMTAQAFELYDHKMKDDGALVVHTSNRHLDLIPVVAANAAHIGKRAFYKRNRAKTVGGVRYYTSVYVTLTNNETYIKNLQERRWFELSPEDGFRKWTDDYSNILSVLEPLRKEKINARVRGWLEDEKAREAAAKAGE